MPNYTLNGLVLALCAVIVLAVAVHSLEQFSPSTPAVTRDAQAISTPVVIRDTPPAPQPVTAPPAVVVLPKVATPEVPRTFYTIDRATEYTANGVKSIPKGRRVNVLEADFGMVAITDGKTTVVVREDRISNDLAEIQKAIGQ